MEAFSFLHTQVNVGRRNPAARWVLAQIPVLFSLTLLKKAHFAIFGSIAVNYRKIRAPTRLFPSNTRQNP
jgi:hypothetical protein